MNNQSKQITPDLQAVAHCLNGTFLIGDLLASFKPSVDDQELFINQLRKLHLEMKSGGYSRDYYQDKIEVFIAKNTIVESKEHEIIELFEEGIDCKLLQLGSKGWQKGKLTICFQFTPEESESIPTQENTSEMHHSPLDEIRQLSNSLLSEQS
jgi:KGK domain